MIYVVDNFLKNPYEVRSKSLGLKYRKGDYYPGWRSFEVDEQIKKYILSKSINLTEETSLRIQKSAEGYDNCSYQYVNKKFQTGNFHTDIPVKYTAILFLTPNPPKKSGLEICDYDFNNIETQSTLRGIKYKFIKNPDHIVNRLKYKIAAYKFNKMFTPIIKVNNKFNRFVLFDGKLYHKQQNFFGNTITDSRLTIATFLI